MDVLENVEGISSIHGYEEVSGLTDSYRDYIQEVLPTQDQELIVSRIDELFSTQPPHAIDANPEVAELLGDSVEYFDSKYLEAPNDIEQAEIISDSMTSISGVDYQTWSSLSLEDKASVLQEIECVAAAIEHRPACRVEFKPIQQEYGHYNCRCSPEMTREQIVESLKGERVITISSEYLDNSFESYKEALNTVIHEGRHVYQEYNLYEREVHPSEGELRNWRMNEFYYKYQPGDDTWVGMKLYDMQPLETDANKFSIDVISKFLQKI